MKNKPIGVFDSGLGGLTVVKEIQQLLPNENIIYLGDTARVPYGTRSGRIVARFALEDTNFLLDRDVKCIIIACNTASALASSVVRKRANKVPVFDVISAGSLDAVRKTKSKKIGIIGTRATVSSHSYKREIGKINRSVECIEVATPLLVPFIEEGEVEGRLLELLLSSYLSTFKSQNIDVLIQGCTHYPLVSNTIQKLLKGVTLVNPAVGVSKEVQLFLTTNEIDTGNKTRGKVEFFVTDLTDRFVAMAEMFLDSKIEGNIKRVDLE